MRAHCITFYDEHSDHIGDIWLTNARDKALLRFDIADFPSFREDGHVDLHSADVERIREACERFLVEQRDDLIASRLGRGYDAR